MKHNLFLAAIILFLASCDNNKKQESSEQKNKQEQKKDDEVAHIMIPESGCYAHYSSGDTILLKIEVFPNVVTGVLKYQLSGKDKNEGTIEGKLDGNKLFVDYTFASEGKTSVREVAFLLNGDEATEGFAEVESANGKMIFKNKADIDFSNGIKFTKIDCVENDEKFRINHPAN